MRIAMLAGAAALAAPMAADAALYKLSFQSGPTTYVSDRDDYELYGLGETRAEDIPYEDFDGVGDPVSATFTVDVSSILNAEYSTNYAYGDLDRESGGSLISGEIDGYDVFGSSVLFGSFDFSTNGAGELTGAGASIAFDFPDYGIGFNEVRWGDAGFQPFFVGGGQWTLSSVDVAPVPLPATAPLLLAGIAALGWYRRRS